MSLLRRQPVFAPMHLAELEAVARSSTELTISAGEVIVREGDVGERFSVIAAGSFDVTMAGEHLTTLDAQGGSFGKTALSADIRRQATVTAATEGALVAIDRTLFLAAVKGHDPSRRAAWRGSHALGPEAPAHAIDEQLTGSRRPVTSTA